jgi:cytoskeletal protein CcmA (bactofilin family)
MFSKPTSNTPPSGQPAATPSAAPQPAAAPATAPAPTLDTSSRPVPARGPKVTSLIAPDMVLEGNISGGGEIQIDGTVKGDVRVEHVTVGDGGTVDGGIYAEAVEIRGKVSGSVTAKQVRLYGACHVDGDITHEQLAMETGAFFQGRSLRLQRPAQPAVAAAPAPRPEPVVTPPRDNGSGSLSAKSAPTASA